MNDHPPREAHSRFISLAHRDIRTATINSPLAFGTAEGIIDTNIGATTVLSSTSAISGSGGLTVTGGGALTMRAKGRYECKEDLEGGIQGAQVCHSRAAAEFAKQDRTVNFATITRYSRTP